MSDYNMGSIAELITLLADVIEEHYTEKLRKQIEKRARLLAAVNAYWMLQDMPLQEMAADVALTAYIIGNLDGRKIDFDNTIQLDPEIWGIISDFEDED
jgi:hypothetical protein